MLSWPASWLILFFMTRTIWLIGGSRGMGLALAAELINRGAAVVISARKRPQHLAHDSYLFKPLDVSNLDALITTAKKLKPLDGVIYMPAVYTPSAIANIKQQPVTRPAHRQQHGTNAVGNKRWLAI